MSETVKLIVEGKEFEFPVITGTEGEKAIDISKFATLPVISPWILDLKIRALPKVPLPSSMGKKASCTTVVTPLRTSLSMPRS